jgi:aminobenzoyl-glutamate utilization protein B
LAEKTAALRTIESRRTELVELADRIWRWAETALRETRSADALAAYAQARGFRVRRGVADMPTAFVAEYGSGRPVIGVLGEYDALPGLSQKAQAAPEPLEAGGAGHGCGHNLFGPASLGAAVAIKELMAAGRLRGTVRFYGTPAEEAVGGKVYMARAGLFSDLDAALLWHPETETTADPKSSRAMVDLEVEFKGKSAHASQDPWNGRSAVDGLELLTHALNLMREHVRPTVRIHYTIADGGKVPNVVPDAARLWLWIRDFERDGVEDVLARVRKAAEGAALAADVHSTLTVKAGSWERLPNRAAARLFHANMTWLGPIPFTAEEHAFARRIQEATGAAPTGLAADPAPLDLDPEPEGGSTDAADVSWIVPTAEVQVTTAPRGVPWHSWPVVACGGMSIGHKGMIYAAQVLATTMVDLFQDPAAVEAIRREFAEKTKGVVYKPYVPEGPPPVP